MRLSLLWIEILSPEDRWNRVQERLHDALTMGVPTIWVIDPYSKEAWIATSHTGSLPVKDGFLRATNPLSKSRYLRSCRKTRADLTVGPA